MYKEKTSLFFATVLLAATVLPAAIGQTASIPAGPTATSGLAGGLSGALSSGAAKAATCDAR